MRVSKTTRGLRIDGLAIKKAASTYVDAAFFEKYRRPGVVFSCLRQLLRKAFFRNNALTKCGAAVLFSLAFEIKNALQHSRAIQHRIRSRCHMENNRNPKQFRIVFTGKPYGVFADRGSVTREKSMGSDINKISASEEQERDDDRITNNSSSFLFLIGHAFYLMA
ncbi:MAG: hypothetical protein ACXWJF_10735 [Burkholderiaceae bacterium]